MNRGWTMRGWTVLALLVLHGLLGGPASGGEATTAAGMEMPITIGVSPPKLEIELGDRPVSEAIRVFNFGSEPAEISVSVHSWTLDTKNEVRLEEPTEQSLDQWMIVSPLRFSVAPGESQTVRFSVRPKVRPRDGEHRAILYFAQAPRKDSPIRVLGRLGVAVYGYAGELQRTGRLNGVQVRERPQPTAFFDVTSSGNAHVRLDGQYAVWRADAYPGAEKTRTLPDLGDEGFDKPDGMLLAGRLPTLPVLPASRRKLAVALSEELPPGRYVLDVNGLLSGAPISLEFPFAIGLSGEQLAVAE